MEDKLLTAEQVSDRLGLCVTTVYRKTRSKEIPSIRLGKSIRYRESDIAKLIKVGSK